VSLSPLAKVIMLQNANEAYVRYQTRRRMEAYALLKQLQEESQKNVTTAAQAAISYSIERPSSPNPDSPQQALLIEDSEMMPIEKKILIDSGYKFP
jgi:hypothetical protein